MPENAAIRLVNVKFPVNRAANAVNLQGWMAQILGEKANLLFEFLLDRGGKVFVIVFEPLGQDNLIHPATLRLYLCSVPWRDKCAPR